MEVCTSAHIEGVLVHIGDLVYFSELKEEVQGSKKSTKRRKKSLKNDDNFFFRERLPLFCYSFTLFIYFFWFFCWKFILKKGNKYWIYFFKNTREGGGAGEGGARETFQQWDRTRFPLLCVLSNDCIRFAMNYLSFFLFFSIFSIFFIVIIKTKYLRLSSSYFH